MKISIVKVHRLLALLLLSFIISHLTIHLTAISDVDMHIYTLSSLRPFYVNWVIEPLLVGAIIMQIIIGFTLLKSRWKQEAKGFWGWVQILSGAYIAIFLVMHTSAALVTRYIVELDTNFYWAAGTLNIGKLPYMFTPYYFLAILSLFSHLAAAIHFGWAGKSYFISPIIMAVGVLIGGLIIMAFSGGFYEIQIPAEYREYYSNF